jgi:hypothetical protein
VLYDLIFLNFGTCLLNVDDDSTHKLQGIDGGGRPSDVASKVKARHLS